MKKAGAQPEDPILARWTYTKEEWKRFARWDNRRQGLAVFLLRQLKGTNSRVQDIVITERQVCFDQRIHDLTARRMVVRRVDIADAGPFNTLEIMYELQSGEKARLKKMRIPVPRGKLKEAVQVQERLQQAFGV